MKLAQEHAEGLGPSMPYVFDSKYAKKQAKVGGRMILEDYDHDYGYGDDGDDERYETLSAFAPPPSIFSQSSSMTGSVYGGHSMGSSRGLRGVFDMCSFRSCEMFSTWEILIIAAELYGPLWIGDMRERYAQIEIQTQEVVQCLERLLEC